MAHAGKAQMLAREGDVAAARAALAAAKGFVSGLSEREASHIAFFDLTFAGRTDDAIAALYPHLTAWPRDALVVSTAANPNGLLGGSGRIGQKHQIAELMDSLAPHYGDDFWFLSYHAMALSEDGRLSRLGPRSSARWPPTRKTRTRRTASLIFVTRAAPWKTPALSCPPGSPPIRVTGFSTAISAGISRCAKSRPATGKEHHISTAAVSR
jgi:hypothetical protein